MGVAVHERYIFYCPDVHHCVLISFVSQGQNCGFRSVGWSIVPRLIHGVLLGESWCCKLNLGVGLGQAVRDNQSAHRSIPAVHTIY